MSPLGSVARHHTMWWYACWVIAGAADSAGLVGMWFGSHPPYWAVSAVLTAACLQTGGLLMWRRWPRNSAGPLICGVGVAGLLQYLANLPDGSMLALGYIVVPLPGILVGHALLLYPDGRFHRRIERVFVAVAYVVALGIRIPNLLVSRTEWLSQCELRGGCIANPFLIRANSPLAYQLDDVSALVVAVLTLGFVGIAAIRVRRGGPAMRRAFRPIIAVIGVLAVSFTLIQRSTWNLRHDDIAYIATYAELGAAVALPVAMAYGLTRARPNVADLITRLERVPPDRVEAELRSILADPTLSVIQRRSGGEVVDLTGRPADEEKRGRARTAVDADVSLSHDPALLDDPSLLSSVAAALRLTLDKARLETEVRVQLHEAQQSRSRLAHAALEERRKLERDLHDGAQQRLLALGMSIEQARGHLDDKSSLTQALDAAATEVTNTLTELRELASGLRPVLLVERGLAAAIPSLARRTPLPVKCDLAIGTRLPDDIEATAYFVISEALQNVVKHAKARQIRIVAYRQPEYLLVEISDDGVGGAVIREHTGLQGLCDRLAAVGGALTVASPPGGGTVVTATIPVPDSPR